MSTVVDAEVIEAQVIPPGMPDILVPIMDSFGPGGRLPESECALLPYQRRWAYARPKFKVFAKSRRIGITWATAYEAVEVAASTRDDGGMDVWYMANALDDAREFIEDCAQWVTWLTPAIGEVRASGLSHIGEMILEDEDEKNILAFTIRFASGFKIHALTSKPRRLRGKQGYAILDEAAFHDGLGAWLKAAAAFLMWGGRMAIISTHNGSESDFNRLVENIRRNPKGRLLCEISIFDALGQGLYTRICRSTPTLRGEATAEGETVWLNELRAIYGADFDEECGLIPSKSGSTFIPRDMIMQRATLSQSDCPVFEWRPETDVDPNDTSMVAMPAEWDSPMCHFTQRARKVEHWLNNTLLPILDKLNAKPKQLYVGVDYGRKANITCIHVLDLSRHMVRTSVLHIELDRAPFSVQDQITDYIWVNLKRIKAGCADAGGLGANSAERCSEKTRGRVAAITMTPPWQKRAWPSVRDRIADETLKLPRYQPLIDDLASVRRDGQKVSLAPSSDAKDGRGQKRHGDAAVAVCLAEAAIPMDKVMSPDKRAGLERRRRRNR